MKSFSLSVLFLLSILANVSVASDITKTFGIHLFFNEREFVDVLVLERGPNGELAGVMHVPEDFDGRVTNVVLIGKTLTFDLFVPKNSARPKDLIFQYTAQFFDKTYNQLIGFVTIKDEPGFTASFTGFARD